MFLHVSCNRCMETVLSDKYLCTISFSQKVSSDINLNQPYRNCFVVLFLPYNAGDIFSRPNTFDKFANVFVKNSCPNWLEHPCSFLSYARILNNQFLCRSFLYAVKTIATACIWRLFCFCFFVFYIHFPFCFTVKQTIWWYGNSCSLIAAVNIFTYRISLGLK